MRGRFGIFAMMALAIGSSMSAFKSSAPHLQMKHTSGGGHGGSKSDFVYYRTRYWNRVLSKRLKARKTKYRRQRNARRLHYKRLRNG